jgi:hypothetical protein
MPDLPILMADPCAGCAWGSEGVGVKTGRCITSIISLPAPLSGCLRPAMDHAPNSSRTMHRASRRHQAGDARHPDSQHRAHETINQTAGLHGLSAWRTDRQDFELRTKQIKALAFKRCPVPFSSSESQASRPWALGVSGYNVPPYAPPYSQSRRRACWQFPLRRGW